MTPAERRRALAHAAVRPALRRVGWRRLPLPVLTALVDAVLDAIRPDLEHCTHSRTIHQHHHETAVANCPWCADPNEPAALHADAPPRRPTATDITDDELDQLYARLDTLTAVCRSNRSAYAGAIEEVQAAEQRAAQAETRAATYRSAWHSARKRARGRVAAETALAALHQGEEEQLDEYTEPTPAQWLWQWNRATPEQRLDAAGRALAAFSAESACLLQNHKGEAPRRRAAEAALARVRQLAETWAVLRTHGGAAYELRAALNPPKET